MRPIPHPPLPSLTAECETVTHSALSSVAPKPVVTRIYRSGQGKLRVDSGDRSVITDPDAGQAIALDHVKKEARIFPIEAPATPPAGPSGLGLPGMPQAPAAPNALPLGKKLIDGHEVEGLQYAVHPPAVPKPPAPGLDAAIPHLAAPAMPHTPALPHAPALPKPPAPPKIPTASVPGLHVPQPAAPHMVEVWTSTKLKFPLLTTVSGRFGKQTSRCKQAVEGEPPPSLFQIPSGYKTVATPQPALPKPRAPKLPFG